MDVVDGIIVMRSVAMGIGGRALRHANEERHDAEQAGNERLGKIKRSKTLLSFVNPIFSISRVNAGK